MLVKSIIFFGESARLACDGQCDKAWGMNSRPKRLLSDDPDDFEFLADGELGEAPADPGTYEGNQGKPSSTPSPRVEQMNRWCARECERASLLRAGEEIHLKTFETPFRNRPA